MQVVHAILKPGEGREAETILEKMGTDIDDFKLIKTDTGDLLIINLLYNNTDRLIDQLTRKFDFEDNRERSLIIFTPDTIIPRDEEKLAQASFHATRESLVTFAQENSSIDFQYIMLVLASAVITSLGLILNNVAVIVGGMVIAPVLGPILAITIGIVLGDLKLIRKGISAEVIGIIIAIVIGSFFGAILPEIEITEALKIRMFPTIADLLIATAAGAAAAYSLIRGQLKTGLVGVMVAASLLPVMCTIGIGIAFGNNTMILGAFILLAGNYLGLLLSNLTVFYFEGLKPQLWYKDQAQKLIKKSLIMIVLAVFLLIIPLGILTVYQFYVEKPVDVVKSTIRENLVAGWDYRIQEVDITGNLINVYIYAARELDKNTLNNIKSQIEDRLSQEYNINFKIIPVNEINI